MFSSNSSWEISPAASSCFNFSACTAAHSAPARAQVKNRQQVATQSQSKLMRERASKQAEAAKAKLKTQLASSKIVKREHIRNQPMDASTRAIFRALDVCPSVQRVAGIFDDLALASSDDEDGDVDA